MYEDAKIGTRLVVVFIDFLIMFILFLLISTVVSKIVMAGVTIPQSVQTWIDNGGSYEEFLKLIQNDEEAMKYLSLETSASFISLGVNFVVFLLYTVVLPLVWKKQTLGRFLLHIKLVTEDGENPKFGTLFLREFVGNGIVNIFIVCCCLPLFINLILVLTKGKAIADYIANTKFIDLSKPIKHEDDLEEVEVIDGGDNN